MYIAAFEDQKEELELLKDMLQLWQQERKTVLRIESFCSAADLLDVARKKKFTLYLLDVMMPGIDGMAAAREIRSFDTSAEIVFLTSFPDFAYEEFFQATFGRTLHYGKIRNVYEQPPVRSHGFSYPFSFQGKLYVCLQEQI